MSDKPTIHELEKILESNDAGSVTLNPDGSVTVGDTWKQRATKLVQVLEEVRTNGKHVGPEGASDWLIPQEVYEMVCEVLDL